VHACKKENGLPVADRRRRQTERIDDLSSTRYTTIIRRPGGRNVRQTCRHCVEPACVSACLVGALQKRPDGPVVYDKSRCMGCRYCMVACPYDIPRYDWNRAVPGVRKCTMCYRRIDSGRKPACVEACPEEATAFGDYDTILAEAKRRATGGAKVYGPQEVGGTLVLYVSDIPLDFLKWNEELGEKPLPKLTHASLSKVPPIAIGMAGLMTGIYWVIGRRMRLQAEAAAQKATETEQQIDSEEKE
jgi:formate dehydrogenase iron-sulfur subunit